VIQRPATISRPFFSVSSHKRNNPADYSDFFIAQIALFFSLAYLKDSS
jgi:hypothetical protein